MRTVKLLLAIFFFVSICMQAQEIKVQRYLGKNLKEVSVEYGKPAYQDAADSSMICTFYKLPNRNYTFVSDINGVYQVNADIKYSSKEATMTAVNGFLKECFETGYAIDTLSTEQYKLHYSGFDLDIKAVPLDEKQQYQIIIGATKRDE